MLTEFGEGLPAQQVTLCGVDEPVHPHTAARFTLKHTERARHLRKLLRHIRLLEEEDGVPPIAARVGFTPHVAYRLGSYKEIQRSVNTMYY